MPGRISKRDVYWWLSGACAGAIVPLWLLGELLGRCAS